LSQFILGIFVDFYTVTQSEWILQGPNQHPSVRKPYFMG